jgi:hypothetical protein
MMAGWDRVPDAIERLKRSRLESKLAALLPGDNVVLSTEEGDVAGEFVGFGNVLSSLEKGPTDAMGKWAFVACDTLPDDVVVYVPDYHNGTLLDRNGVLQDQWISIDRGFITDVKVKGG